LDVDLEVEGVLYPERYPLVSRVHEAGEGYAPAEQAAEIDEDKIDACVLALLQLTLHDGVWAWKGQDFEVMNRLFENGYILDPRNKTKSVMLTEKGLVRSKELFEELFGKKGN
jgi:predicted RNase H-like nuclease